MSDILYTKIDCAHCSEPMLIEVEGGEINVFIPADTVLAKLRTPAPAGDRRFKMNKPKKTEERNISSKPRLCSKCGGSGHRRDTCPETKSRGGYKDDLDETPDEPKGNKPLSEGQYDFVQDNKKGMTSLQMANEMNMPLEEVNKAFVARDYDYYIEHR